MAIGASVGRGGTNALADVLVVQHLLNDWLAATNRPPLPTDGDSGPRTVAAIQAFQAHVLGGRADGRVDPGGATWTALATGAGLPVLPSGTRWWQAYQARFPNSAALSDLASPFRARATAFVEALRAAGASVSVASTRRNRTRAQVMHYAWRVANGALAPAKVPAIAGARIDFDHGTLAASRRGAQELVDRFDLAYPPSLTSNHIEGRAIDMTIRWTGTIQVEEKSGKRRAVAAPRTGEANTTLHAIGATYGVHKLLSDPPHWSDDGK